MAEYKKFLKLCLVFGIILCLSLLSNYIVINNANENLSYKEIVETQLSEKAIWGSALNPHVVSYKYELYKHEKPEILALGSSLGFTLRQEFFTASFTNCSGVVPFLHWGTVFLRQILKFHKPHLLILVLDFWQFNDRFPPSQQSDPDFADRGTDYLAYKLRQPYVWLWERKLSLADYGDILLFKKNRNGITNYNNMGVLAIKRSEGFRDDGSYSHAWLLSGLHRGFYDRKFAASLKSVATGADKFGYGDSLATATVNELNAIIKLCQERQINLIVIVPPVAPTVLQAMQKKPGAYEFIDKLRQLLASLPVEAYDFFDSPEVSDGEFIDGYHPGEVAYEKILLRIIGQNPESALREYLNSALLQRSVKLDAGKAMTSYDKAMYNYKEADFLEIGCLK